MAEDGVALRGAVGFPSCRQARTDRLLASKLSHLTEWVWEGGVVKVYQVTERRMNIAQEDTG